MKIKNIIILTAGLILLYFTMACSSLTDIRTDSSLVESMQTVGSDIRINSSYVEPMKTGGLNYMIINSKK